MVLCSQRFEEDDTVLDVRPESKERGAKPEWAAMMKNP
jgi:hypothetical protein